MAHAKTLIACLSLVPALAFAQPNPAAQAARQWRQQHERAIVAELATLLAIPNVSSDRSNLQRNAELIAKMMERRGIKTRLIAVPDANPIVFGELATPGATRTLVFYAHYDGQPVQASEWTSPPFEPVLRDKPLESGGTIVQETRSNAK